MLGRPAACSARGCSSFARLTARPSSLPTRSSALISVPARLRGFVTGVIGLDPRPLQGKAGVSAASVASRRTRLSAHAASSPSSARPRSGTPVGCAPALATGGFTPNQYLSAYDYEPLHAQGLIGQGQRVALIEVDGFNYSDIKHFANCFGLAIPALNGFGVGVARPGLAPGGESTLDLEVLDAAAPGLKSIDVYETQAHRCGHTACPDRALGAPGQKPQIISASLGLCEPVLYDAVGAAGIGAAEGALQMAAASGITFLASSGDQGSADCTRPDGVPFRLLSVNYPASSWWATGVGGTNLVLSGANAISSQVVWNDAALQPGSAGGGGASHLFARPGYQVGVVGRQARAVPDVAMLADVAPGYAVYCSARGDCVNQGNTNPWQAVGGTSAATPLLAGGMAMIDQALGARHQRQLGLVNPLLYGRSAAGAFLRCHRPRQRCRARAAAHPQAAGLLRGAPGLRRGLGPGQRESGRPGGDGAGQPARQVTQLSLSLPRSQHALRAGRILATVACTGPCLAGAYARIPLGRGRSLELDSPLTRLAATGQRTLILRFSRSQLPRVRALGRRRPVAQIRGVLFDPVVYGVLPRPGNAIQHETAARSLSLTGEGWSEHPRRAPTICWRGP